MVAAPAADRLAAPTMRLMLPLVCVVLALGLCRRGGGARSVPGQRAAGGCQRGGRTSRRDRRLRSRAGAGRRPSGGGSAGPAAGGADAAQRALLSFGGNTGADGVALIEARFDAARGARIPGRDGTSPRCPTRARPCCCGCWPSATGRRPGLAPTSRRIWRSRCSRPPAHRGLPLLLPVLDLTERSRVAGERRSRGPGPAWPG